MKTIQQLLQSRMSNSELVKEAQQKIKEAQAKEATAQLQTILHSLSSLGLLYNSSKDEFWWLLDGEWSKLSDAHLKQQLHVRFPCSSEEQIQEVMQAIMEQEYVRTVIDIAGYKPGAHLDANGRPWLVPRAMPELEPADVDWTELREFLEQLLDGQRQLDYFYSWLKWDDLNRQKGLLAPGQLLVLVGSSGSGKTMLQERVISPFMGGLPADCLHHMTGERSFNDSLYVTRHWIIADGTTFGREKIHFTENIKRALVNKVHSIHAKYRSEVNVLFCPRISMSVNESNLQSVPDLEEGIEDKVMLFKVTQPRRLPSATYPQEQFEHDIARGLPGLKHFIRHVFEIPGDIAETSAVRYGVKTFQHPEMVVKMSGSQDLFELYELLSEYWKCGSLEHTARQVYDYLTRDTCGARKSIESLVHGKYRELGKLLSKLADWRKTHNDSVVKKNEKQRGSAGYIITVPSRSAEAVF